jgi:hypothetical protein
VTKFEVVPGPGLLVIGPNYIYSRSLEPFKLQALRTDLGVERASVPYIYHANKFHQDPPRQVSHIFFRPSPLSLNDLAFNVVFRSPSVPHERIKEIS